VNRRNKIFTAAALAAALTVAATSAYSVTALQAWQMVVNTVLETIGVPTDSKLSVIVPKIDKSLNQPLRLYAAITPDAKLYVTSSRVETGDGSGRSPGQAESTVPTFAASSLNYQTGATSGGTYQVDGGAFALPSCAVGQFRRHAYSYDASANALNTHFSAEAASVGALADAGTLFAALDGLSLGYVDLECTNSAGQYKTAGSSTNIVENAVGGTARVVNFESRVGSMAFQNHFNVGITGGTLDGVTITNSTISDIVLDDVRLADPGAGDLELTSNGGLTADRTLTFDTNDASRTIEMSGNLSIDKGFSVTGSGASLTLNTAGTTLVDLPTSGTLATLAGTEAFTNKDLTSPTNVLSGATATNFTNGGTVTLPSGTDTLVARNTTDTLTNKTLTGNTAANLVSGSGTLVLNTSGTVTAPNLTGTLVTQDGAQVLTNKDHDGGTASNTSRLTVPKDTTTNLTSLTRKQATIVYSTDETKLYVDDGTQLVAVGSGSGSGETNVVLNPDGDTALDGGRTDDIGDWLDSGTGIVSSRTSTAAEIPLYPLKTKAIKLTNAGSGTGSTRMRFELTPSLRTSGRRIKVQWEQVFDGSPSYASGDYRVEVYNYSDAYVSGEAEKALNTDVSGVSAIAALNQRQTFIFEADGRQYYELRIVRQAGSAGGWLALNNVVIGPGLVTTTVASPVVYKQSKTAVVAVGSSGNNQQGHALADDTFPVLADKLAFWRLTSATTTADGSTGTSCSAGAAACTLTNNGTTLYNSTDIFGTAASVANLNGTTQYFSSTDAFLDPGDTNFFGGCWVKATDWTPASFSPVMSQYPSTTDRGWVVGIDPTGGIFLDASVDGTTQNTNTSSSLGFTDGTWHHIAIRYDASSNTVYGYADGRFVSAFVLPGNLRNVTTNAFALGASRSPATQFLAGSLQDCAFAQNGTFSDMDVRKMASAKLSHNLAIAPEDQLWSGNWYRSDSEITNQFADSWIVDKGPSALYYEFRDIAVGAFVDYSLQYSGYAPQAVGVRRFDTGFLSSTPATTYTHGLGAIPKSVSVMYETSTDVFEYLNSNDWCSVTATQLQCEWTGLTVGASNRVRIVASMSDEAMFVDVAAANTAGMVSTGDQVLGSGSKTVLGSFTAGPTTSATTAITHTFRNGDGSATNGTNTVVISTGNQGANAATLKLQNSLGAANDTFQVSVGSGVTTFRNGTPTTLAQVDNSTGVWSFGTAALAAAGSTAVSVSGDFDIQLNVANQIRGVEITNQNPGGYGSSLNFYSKKQTYSTALAQAAAVQVEGAGPWNSASAVDSRMHFKVVSNDSLITSATVYDQGSAGDTVDGLGVFRVYGSGDGTAGITVTGSSTGQPLVSIGQGSGPSSNNGYAKFFGGNSRSAIPGVTITAHGQTSGMGMQIVTSGCTSYWTAGCSGNIASVAESLSVGTALNSGVHYGIFVQNMRTTTQAGGDYYARFGDWAGLKGWIIANSTTGVLYQSASDGRLKKEDAEITNGLALVQQLRPVNFKWKSNDESDRGFIAQELKAVLPEAVSGSEAGDVATAPMGVDYGRITPVLAAAIKELKAELDAVKAEFDAYKAAHP
jgi:hypothetical protein